MERSDAPRIVGRYALYDVIATGGMASVHLGRLAGPVGFSRTVAIKRLHEQFARDPDFVAMFLDEARIVARIRHPNVVPTLDVVALEGDLLIVMEYVAGESLFHLLKHARLTRTPVPIPILVDIMIGVLHGLHAAHEATDERGEPLGIVHRDVSPQNIIVGADGVARVLDFGVAKAVGRSQRTEDGQIKGKLRYMAPEQIQGNGVTRMADLYATAIVLWEALAGRAYLVAETTAELMFRALDTKPSAPSKWRPEVTPALEEVVLRGLSRDPSARYPSARAMADALQAAVTPIGRGVVADWVAESARAGIDTRARLVAEVESDVSFISGSISRPVEGAIPAPPPSEPSSASLERSLSEWSPQRPRARTPRFVLVAVAATVLGGAAALALHRSVPAPSSSEDSPPSPAASSTTASATPTASETAEPATSTSAASAATPPPVASSSASAPAARRDKPRPAAATKPAAKDTSPPPDRIYVRD